MISKPLDCTNWYVLYTFPNYEKKVYLSFLKNRIISFLPLQKIVRQWSDRKKTIEIPLFPNYIFVKTNEKDRFGILSHNGVKKYVCFGGKPVKISEDDISGIKKMMLFPDVNVEQSLSVGGFVEIIDGPLKDMKGVLFEKGATKRLAVKIESINQILSVEVHLDWVKLKSS